MINDNYKKQLESMQKLAHIGVWEYNLKEKSLTWSSEIYNIFEFNVDNFEPTYENFLNLIHPEDRQSVNAAYLRSLKTKEPYDISHRLLMNDGRVKYVNEQCDTIFDSDGSPILSKGTVQDITELATANILIQKERDKLRKQQEELQAIFDNTIDGLAIIDKDTNFLKVNKTYCEITGLSEEELLKTSCMALTNPEDLEEAKKSHEELLSNRNPQVFEKSCLIAGKKVQVRLASSWLPNNEHILINMKDISKAKLIEEQSKLIAMGEMIGNIAHQWRQPLSTITSIASGINLLKQYDKLEDYDISKDMNTILNQANYLSNTIDDFMNFIDTTNTLKNISIKECLEKTLSILHPVITINNLLVLCDFQDDINIDGFENELIQSFINIINNAKDALLENTKDMNKDKLIFISTKKVGNELVLEFKDSGGGIKKSDFNRIFEPYFTTKHQSFGTGIGLSMTYKLLTQRHNSTIDIENVEFKYQEKEYKGLSFKIYFLIS